MPRIRIVRHSELRCVLRSGPCRPEGSIEHVENCFALLQEAMTISECTRLAIHGPEDELAKLDREAQFLVRAYPLLGLLQALDVVVVISGDHNDPESWWDWTDKEKQKDYTRRFKRRLATARTERTDCGHHPGQGAVPRSAGAALHGCDRT